MPRKRAGYGRWTSGKVTGPGLRKRFRKVTLIARPTAPTSWPVSRQNPGAPLAATGTPRRDDVASRHEQHERRRHQELPRDRQDLVDTDPHEGPAHPRDQEKDED